MTTQRSQAPPGRCDPDLVGTGTAAGTAGGDGGTGPADLTVGPVLRQLHEFGLADTFATEYAECLSWVCPFCGVPTGALCLTNAGASLARPHLQRLRRARRQPRERGLR